VLMGVRQRFPVPNLKALGLGVGTPTQLGDGESYEDFDLARAHAITLRFNAPGAPPPSLHARGGGLLVQPLPDGQPDRPLSTAGRISVLQLPVHPVHATLTQPREAGVAPLVIEIR